MKVSDYIVSYLEGKGVKCVFEMSGGMIAHLLDSLQRSGKTRVVSMHHEQAAAFAADAVGRMTGTPGVAMATSGPGATNLLTGIGSCYFAAFTIYMEDDALAFEALGLRACLTNIEPASQDQQKI